MSQGKYDDGKACPICGQPNECAVAHGREHESCWCWTATMAPEVLDAVPEDAKGAVCVCAKCAAGPLPESRG